MNIKVRKALMDKAEVKYKEFSAALIPKSKPLLGVRLPILRSMAKAIVKSENWIEEIKLYDGEYQDIYFEEVMLRGMIIGYGSVNMDVEKALDLVRAFIPCIDNWSVCDSFCNSLSFVQKNRDRVWEFLQEYLVSDKEFYVRTALIIILNHYLKFDKNGKKLSRKRIVTKQDLLITDNQAGMNKKYPYLEKIMAVLNQKYTQGYYAQMAVAWTTAEAFVTFPYITLEMLQNNCKMDEWTYKKSIQKICESKTPDDEVKIYLKELKKDKYYERTIV